MKRAAILAAVLLCACSHATNLQRQARIDALTASADPDSSVAGELLVWISVSPSGGVDAQSGLDHLLPSALRPLDPTWAAQIDIQAHAELLKTYKTIPGWRLVRVPVSETARAISVYESFDQRAVPLDLALSDSRRRQFTNLGQSGTLNVLVERNRRLRLDEAAFRGTIHQPVPSPPAVDPDIGLQTYLNLIHAPEAWQICEGDSSVVVAIIDSGINLTHEDLVGHLWVNPSKGTFNSIPEGDHGIDLIHGGEPIDDYGHGTHMAGIIGAVAGNAFGGRGIAPKVQLMAIKAFDQTGASTDDLLLSAFDFVNTEAQKGVNIRVVNCSWRNPESSSHQDAIATAATHNIVTVAAAGNTDSDVGTVEPDNDIRAVFPASYPLDSIIAVAWSDDDDEIDGQSHFGATSVDLAAPASAVYSTCDPCDANCGQIGKYGYCQGTSQAAAMVSGAVALLAGCVSGLSPQDIRCRVINTTDLGDGFFADRNVRQKPRLVSGGRLNVLRLLNNTANSVSRCP